jgi:hypothetical protein
MTGGMKEIRKQYRVPAKRGGKVLFEYIGKICTITSAAQSHRLVIKDDDGKRYLVHPTWMMRYLSTQGAT